MSIKTNLRVEAGFVPQAGPQLAFIQCPADIVIYGGARGGGKTYASLGEFWIHAEDYGTAARGLMVRKTREDLKDAISVGNRMFGRAAAWREKGGFFQFTNGARLYCAYLETDRDAENYQGWSLTRVYVEELTQYATSGPIFRLLATLRSPEGVPCQMRATCNPGGAGHHWVRDWVIDNGPYTTTIDPETGLSRVFIPARVQDNPALLANDPNYVSKLKASGTPQLVRAWLEGDWNVIEGAFFPEFSIGAARHLAVCHPRRLDPLPVDGLGLRQAVFRRLVGGGAGRSSTRRDDLASRGDRPLSRILRHAARQTERGAEAAGRTCCRGHCFP